MTRVGLLARAACVVGAVLLAACGDVSPPPDRTATQIVPTDAAPAATAPATTPGSVVPLAFRGAWNLQPGDCQGGTGDGRLTISSRGLEFYESHGEVISTEVTGDRLLVQARMTGEGETWEETYSFRLSPDGGSLWQGVVGGGEGVRRVRCPGPAPEELKAR